ncbi:hypothetical protein H920_07423 [Fukomys damarensis]|uniref:Uncharacterized protein n=1 Tax=Fukomys damarensis TaxID=885580 RepID=A0A091DJJ9_FUKDA|nr:hypothetical protein H920_07423 [Fukomys damarensis]
MEPVLAVLCTFCGLGRNSRARAPPSGREAGNQNLHSSEVFLSAGSHSELATQSQSVLTYLSSAVDSVSILGRLTQPALTNPQLRGGTHLPKL